MTALGYTTILQEFNSSLGSGIVTKRINPVTQKAEITISLKIEEQPYSEAELNEVQKIIKKIVNDLK